jgi:hypothetical protein
LTEYVRQGNPNWYKGQPSANPLGRPKGTGEGKKVRNAREQSLTALAEHVAEQPHEPRSAVQILQDFANDKSIPTSLRISAAAAAAPYERPKLLPVPGPVYLHSQIDIPAFACIEDAEAFLLTLSQREAAGELETASVQTVSDRVRAWIQSKRTGEELALKKYTAGNETGEQVVRIEGGLPTLPGTNVTMPQLNGHNGYDPNGLLPPPNASTTGHMPAIESVPDQPCSVMAFAPQPAPVAPPATHTHHGPPQSHYGAHASFQGKPEDPSHEP